MALHDELAELRAAVGPHVFDDPVAFRAAFDDFIPEGSASTGEVSLLVGAIATGALQRLTEQLSLGADPATSIAVQGDLLARDRGTSESSGARWALSALAHAVGAIPAEKVPTRPTPSPDSVETAGRPPAFSPTQRPTIDDPGPTHQVPDATLVASQESPDRTPTAAAGPRKSRNPLLVGAVAVLVIVAVASGAFLVLRDDDPDDAADDRSSEAADAAGGDEEVLAQADLEDAGTTVRLQLVRNGTDADLVMLADQDGEYVEVDRQPAHCPYLDGSYDPGIEAQDGNAYFYGWQNRDSGGFGGYGEVQADEGLLIVYENPDPCPTG